MMKILGYLGGICLIFACATCLIVANTVVYCFAYQQILQPLFNGPIINFGQMLFITCIIGALTHQYTKSKFSWDYAIALILKPIFIFLLTLACR